MDYIKRDDAKRFKNSPSCTAIEYDFKDENDFNIAKIELNGRYPEAGFALNAISKELVYVTHGHGSLTTADTNIELHPGDAVLIKPQEKYFFEGEMELLISSSPAWTPDQHQTILD